MQLWASGPIVANALQRQGKFSTRNARYSLAKKSHYKLAKRNCERLANT